MDGIPLIRVHTPLQAGLEVLIHETIGCCIRVHRELGRRLLERIYARAVCIELAAADIRFESEASIPTLYRGELVARQRLDIGVVLSYLRGGPFSCFRGFRGMAL